MADCERCHEMPGYCRQCKRQHVAEHFYTLKSLTGSAGRPFPPFEALPDADKLGWLAVADAHLTMER